jgi:hypothetical protein
MRARVQSSVFKKQNLSILSLLQLGSLHLTVSINSRSSPLRVPQVAPSLAGMSLS